MKFWDALEIWEATPLREDTAVEARDLVAQLDRINATLQQIGKNGSSAGRAGSEEVVAALLEPLPGLLAAYYAMRMARTFGKRIVRKGLSSSIVYANIAIAAVFFRVVAPRLLAAGSLDDLFDAGVAIGIPDRATLTAMLEGLQGYDTWIKLALYSSAFVLEKLTMVSEILPIQIGLKTVAPVLFGGLLPGAIASAACETLGAFCNFLIGRSFLTQRVRDISIFGSPPLGEAGWFGALSRAAESDGLRLVLLLRLAPVLPLPFDSYWYLLGALPVMPLDFAIAHFLGCLKTAFLDASFGMLLLTSVSLDGGQVQSQAQQIVLSETAAFTVVAVLVGTVATKLANELLGLDEDEEVAPAADADHAMPRSGAAAAATATAAAAEAEAKVEAAATSAWPAARPDTRSSLASAARRVD